MPRSITTRTGDHGTTRLYSGEEVAKDSPRPAACGDLDELICVLGLARLHLEGDPAEAVLRLQRELFAVGSEIATLPPKRDRLPQRIDADAVARLEGRREALEAAISLPNGFIVPGGSPAGAQLDLARALARRLERRVVALQREGELANQHLLVWLNRLSDYLFLLARRVEPEPTMVRESGDGW